MNKLAERSSPKNEEMRDLDLDRGTAATQARYDRIAPFYDVMEWATERAAFRAWREELWSRIPSWGSPNLTAPFAPRRCRGIRAAIRRTRH
jgi:hypothetical protein